MSTMTDPVHLRATQMFIDANSVDVVIMRQAIVDDGAGGYALASPETVNTYTCRRVGRGAPPERTSELGHTVIPQWTFVFMPDVDVKVGDMFELDGHTHEVLSLEQSPPWALRAEVYERG